MRTASLLLSNLSVAWHSKRRSEHDSEEEDISSVLSSYSAEGLQRERALRAESVNSNNEVSTVLMVDMRERREMKQKSIALEKDRDCIERSRSESV